MEARQPARLRRGEGEDPGLLFAAEPERHLIQLPRQLLRAGERFPHPQAAAETIWKAERRWDAYDHALEEMSRLSKLLADGIADLPVQGTLNDAMAEAEIAEAKLGRELREGDEAFDNLQAAQEAFDEALQQEEEALETLTAERDRCFAEMRKFWEAPLASGVEMRGRGARRQQFESWLRDRGLEPEKPGGHPNFFSTSHRHRPPDLHACLDACAAWLDHLREVYVTEDWGEGATKRPEETVLPLRHLIGVLKPWLLLNEHIETIADDEEAVGRLATEVAQAHERYGGYGDALEAYLIRKLFRWRLLQAVVTAEEGFRSVRWSEVGSPSDRWKRRRDVCSRRILVALSHGALDDPRQVYDLERSRNR